MFHTHTHPRVYMCVKHRHIYAELIRVTARAKRKYIHLNRVILYNSYHIIYHINISMLLTWMLIANGENITKEYIIILYYPVYTDDICRVYVDTG